MMLSAKPNRARGFSLTELLVTLTIVGVTSAIGFPMLSEYVEDAAVSTQTDLVLDTLNYTRSEAVKRNTRITMCRSTTGTSCAASSTSNDWRIGWIVFVDDTLGGTVGVVDATETVLRVQSVFSGRGKLEATGGTQNYVSYISNGQTRDQNGLAIVGNFYMCGKSVKTKRRRIALTAGTGWVGATIIAPAGSCTA
ncbi:GspH/FimT family pseudopilin [Massilia pseudoviolaceinigra]|uniref:GspH/FimT family pseudopilin n=1 Tax=Massilia pseudoviolaceinigra TaxID=3057165 RepID=UPI0027969E29|nr:GspH/FimT family pseudopilin [Massilia sp. CCM 9206]MDQ1920651.1 GspH/FimT family pseudopilin [Massilia sp. CCM 9206]